MAVENEIQFSAGKGKYFQKYLQYAALVITSYNGNEPFHLFIKKYFSLNKKHGSNDRKMITALCYYYFRVCNGVSYQKEIHEKLLLGFFICENKSSSLLGYFKPEWNLSVDLPLKEKLLLIQNEFSEKKLFPFHDDLSDQIDYYEKFSLSFLVQPKLFIRVRPGYKSAVLDKLKKAKFLFEEISNDCISFLNNEKVSSVIEVDREAVIQDYNSQQTLAQLAFLINQKEQLEIWDCCAGSGGKSILAYDLFKNIKLTVSDTRKSILDNLKTRFKKASLKNYQLIKADLQKPSDTIKNLFDIIIADVPCSGSGTWSRTPEQLSFFNKTDIEKYALLQRNIINNTLPHFKPNGHLLYITCSVFKNENEENIDFIIKKHKLDLIEMKYLKGYEMQSDTMFTALLKKIE